MENFNKFYVVLLAAGEGSRMRPFSSPQNPKILLPFLGKPLLAWQLEEFIQKKFRNFIIVCNPQNIEKIKKYFTHYQKKSKLKIQINYALQEEQLGPSHAIWCAKKYLRQNDYLLFKYADSVADQDQITPLMQAFQANPQEAIITLKEVDDPTEYGLVKFENKTRLKSLKNQKSEDLGFITQIIEKPSLQKAPSLLGIVGIGILKSSSFLKAIEKDNLFKGKKEVVPQEYILREGKKANWWVYPGRSLDLGRPWNILEVNQLFIEKYGGRIEAKLPRNVRVSPQVYLSKDTQIEPKCVIGPYSSLDAVVISRGGKIKNSYLMSGAKIGAGSKIYHSVIGRKVLIGKNFQTKTKKSKPIKVWVKNKYVKTSYKNLGCFIGHQVKIADNLMARPGKIVYDGKIIQRNITHNLLLKQTKKNFKRK